MIYPDCKSSKLSFGGNFCKAISNGIFMLPCSVFWHIVSGTTTCTQKLSANLLAKSKYPAFGQVSKDSIQLCDKQRRINTQIWVSASHFLLRMLVYGLRYSIICLFIFISLRRYTQLTIIYLFEEKNVNLNPLIWKINTQFLSCQVEPRLTSASLNAVIATSLKKIKNKIQCPCIQYMKSNKEQNKLQ